MAFEYLQQWLKLSDQDKKDLFRKIATDKALPESAVEKDWWVSLTLRVIFQMEIAPHLVFKGGTSLSKGWGLIERFSEDIDLAIDREYLGHKGELSRSGIKKLRKDSQKYMLEKFIPHLIKEFIKIGITDLEINPEEITSSDQDPIIVRIKYKALTPTVDYLPEYVKVEIACRSLREPFSPRKIASFIDEEYADKEFASEAIEIACVNPERTLLEKVFLLHEEFQRPAESQRVDRMSRHLYDIYKISNTGHVDKAFQDLELYRTIIAHRKKFTPVGQVDYSTHQPKTLVFLPPEGVFDAWQKDYQFMNTSMIHEDAPKFTDLIKELSALQDRIRTLK